MNVVIYARYSSHSQTEQSIEGQLHTCYEYAKNNGYLVVGEYIDRAQSGTTDSRAEFQRMIADSDKHTFEGVLVYQLDRFARNRYDSAINKAKLKKNGVRVISARENISDDASGILVEGVLESMAEYYSAELSQKIRRGMDINAEKCLSNGSNPGLGYRVDEERRFHIDPEGAAVVREIFEQYASGKTVTEIIQSLNARQIKTSKGKAFNKNSLHRLLRNRRYIGYYIYKGVETPDGMPRILEDELFERVQHILDRNKKAPARARGREEYLLTTKLFCGYCREMMTGYGGTGKSGKAYHYYACNNFKRRKCKKKVISKEKIENRVVLECRKLLTDSNIEHIAASVAAVCESDRDTVSIKRIKAAIQEADTAIENLWKALEKGQAADMITERIEKRQSEKEELQAQLAIEMNKQVRLSAPDIRAYLYALKYGDKNDENTKRGIINIFLRAIYLFDETFTLILNGSDRPIVIDDILLDEIEEGLDDDLANHNLCSPLVADAPPRRRGRIFVRGFLSKDMQNRGLIPGYQGRGFRFLYRSRRDVPVYVVFKQPVTAGGDGDAQEHTEDAHHAPAHGDGGEHPDPGQLYGRADDVGIDEVALDLLEDDYKYNEDKRLDGRLHEYQERADAAADERADYGYERGEGRERADHCGVGEAEHQHTRQAERAKYQRLGALADDEAVEAAVKNAGHIPDFAAQPVAEIAFNKPVALGRELFLAEQHIDREYYGEEGGGRAGHSGRNRPGDHAHHVGRPAEHGGDYALEPGLPVKGLRPLRQACNKLVGDTRLNHPLRRPVQRDGYLGEQQAHAADQLGQDEPEYEREYGQQRQYGENEAQARAGLYKGPAARIREEVFFIEAHEYVERISERQPEQQRHEGGEQHAEEARGGRPVVYGQEQHKGRERDFYKRARAYLFHLSTSAAPAGAKLYAHILSSARRPVKAGA